MRIEFKFVGLSVGVAIHRLSKQFNLSGPQLHNYELGIAIVTLEDCVRVK